MPNMMRPVTYYSINHTALGKPLSWVDRMGKVGEPDRTAPVRAVPRPAAVARPIRASPNLAALGGGSTEAFAHNSSSGDTSKRRSHALLLGFVL